MAAVTFPEGSTQRSLKASRVLTEELPNLSQDSLSLGRSGLFALGCPRLPGVAVDCRVVVQQSVPFDRPLRPLASAELTFVRILPARIPTAGTHNVVTVLTHLVSADPNWVRSTYVV